MSGRLRQRISLFYAYYACVDSEVRAKIATFAFANLFIS